MVPPIAPRCPVARRRLSSPKATSDPSGCPGRDLPASRKGVCGPQDIGAMSGERTGGVQRREGWLGIWVLGQGCCGHLVGMSWSVHRPSGCKDSGPRSNGCWTDGQVLCHMDFHTELVKWPRTWHLAPPEQMREREGERCVEAMTWPQKSHPVAVTPAACGWSHIPALIPRERTAQGRE